MDEYVHQTFRTLSYSHVNRVYLYAGLYTAKIEPLLECYILIPNLMSNLLHHVTIL